MSYTIAVAGKGGTGKTTTCGLLIDYLSKQKKGPILAVDADANSNLNEVLGIEIETTIGDIREEIAQAEMLTDNPIPPNMTKADYANWKFNSALAEEDDFDMLVMGRSQGAGCYCYVNGVLSSMIGKFSTNYSYVIVDNEAGMEHVSRGVLPKADMILLVSDCSRRGVQAVGRISKLIKDINLKAKQVKLVINRAPNGIINDGIKEEIALQELDLIGILPQDEQVYEFDSAGKPTVQLPENNPVKVAIAEIVSKLNI